MCIISVERKLKGIFALTSITRKYCVVDADLHKLQHPADYPADYPGDDPAYYSAGKSNQNLHLH